MKQHRRGRPMCLPKITIKNIKTKDKENQGQTRRSAPTKGINKIEIKEKEN